MDRITKSDLKQYLKIEENRLALNRIAGDFDKQAKELKEHFVACVRASGGPEKMLIEHGHRLTLHTEKGSVAWKDEFIRVAGIEAAEKLIAGAEPRESLKIEPVGDAKK